MCQGDFWNFVWGLRYGCYSKLPNRRWIGPGLFSSQSWDPIWAYFWRAVNKGPTCPWPGYFWPNLVRFFLTCRAKNGVLGGKFCRFIGGWSDPASKIFEPNPSLSQRVLHFQHTKDANLLNLYWYGNPGFEPWPGGHGIRLGIWGSGFELRHLQAKFDHGLP